MAGHVTREQFFAPGSPKGEPFTETLLRYGKQYQQAAEQAKYSLFGMDEVAVSRPPVPAAEPWPALERLNREKELVGIYLSAHPLDEYSFIVKRICNMRTEQLAEATTLFAVDQELTLGGIVTEVKTAVSSRDNKPFGIVTIEDYSTAGTLRFFGQDWVRWQPYMQRGSMLFIRAKVQASYYPGGNNRLVIGSIEFLADVKDSVVQSITVQLPVSALDGDTALTISEMARQSPGNALLRFDLLESDGVKRVTVQAKQKVRLSHQLMDYLEHKKQLTCIIN